MAWDDAAPTAEELKLKPATVSWDDAPPTPEELGKTEMTLKGLAKNAVSDVGGMIKGLGDTINQGAYEIPKTVGKSLDQSVLDLVTGRKSGPTPLADKMNTIEEHAPEMAREMVRPVTHPWKYAYEHPVSQAMNVLGLATGAAGIAKAAAPGIAEGLESTANTLSRRGLGFTKRFLNTEGKMISAQDAAKVALDEGVVSPGATPEEMLDRAKNLHERSGQKIGEILKGENQGATRALPANAPPNPSEQFLFNPQDAIKQIEKLRPRSSGGTVLRGGEYNAQNEVISDAVDTIKAHGDRPIPWDEANELKGNLQGLANYDTTKSRTVNTLRKQIGGVFRQTLDDQLTKTMSASGRDIAPFIQAKRLYKASEAMIDGLTNRLSSEMGNKGVGLTDYLAAGVGGHAGGGGGAMAAFAAKRMLEKYGVTAGATMARKLAVAVQAVPELFGRFTPALRQAIQSGPQQLESVHTHLMNNSRYRGIIEDLNTALAAPEAAPVKAPPVPPTAAEKITLTDYSDAFARRNGVPSATAGKWMAAYKRSPAEASKLIADYADTISKNPAASRKWRLDIRNQLAQDALSVKVGGLNRGQVKRVAASAR